MQLLWIGCLESEDEFKRKAKKGYNLSSAQVSQKNLLDGIEKVTGQKFDSINGSVLPPYPVYADKHIDEVFWNHQPGCYDVSVGYANYKYLNRFNCKQAMLKAANKWIKEKYKGDELVIFTYSMRSAPMATACYIKKILPTTKIYLIVTDLPQFMDLGQSKVKEILKKMDWLFIKKMQSKFDGFILYASKMAEYLHIPDNKWMLMEGSYDGKDISNVILSNKKKAIMYSGKLDIQYGIPMLVDAFMSIHDSEAELWITGGGNAEAYVKQCAEKDSRIKYFGFLPNRTDVLNLQKQASLLVNMRLPSESASSYCFPSKLFEYMITGVPVLTFRLGGIPKEYYQYLYLIDEENVDAVKYAIETALTSDCKIGENAKKFILKNKTSEEQSRRIVKWMTQKID